MGPTKPTIQWVSRALSPAAKRPEHEVNLSPPADVKNWWSYISTSPISLRGLYRNNFTSFTITTVNYFKLNFIYLNT